MRICIVIFTTFIFIVLLNACKTEESKVENSNPSTDESLYFGQRPPGLTPEVFNENLSANNKWKLADVTEGMKQVYLSSSEPSYFLYPVVVFHQDENQYNVWNKYNFYPSSNGNDSVLYCKNK